MAITLTNLKWHIVTEMLILKYSRHRNVFVPDATQHLWIYYRHEMEEADYNIESIISHDPDMISFYNEWESYNTMLPAEEIRLPIITLAMKLVLAKALKYADDITLNEMMKSINDKMHLN